MEKNKKYKYLITAIVIVIIIASLGVLLFATKSDKSGNQKVDISRLNSSWTKISRKVYKNNELSFEVKEFLDDHIIFTADYLRICELDEKTYEETGTITSICNDYDYKIDDSTIKVLSVNDGQDVEYTYELEENDEALTLRNGDDSNYFIEYYERAKG